MKRILITSPDSMVRAFLLPHIEVLLEQGCEVDIACSKVDDSSDAILELLDGRVRMFQIDAQRRPGMDSFQGVRQLKTIIKKGNYDLIWTHGPVMGVITRLAARTERKHGLKVAYMAHGFHFCKGAPLKSWILYYPVEWLCSFWTDMLITINREDHELAQRHLHTKEVRFVPGVGVDLKRFRPFDTDRCAMRERLGLKEDDFVILSVGELSERKNHSVLISALERFRDNGALARIQYLICGAGPLGEELRQLADALGVAEHVHFLGYRKDVSDICNCSDIFAFPSLKEGLPVALMEAMACGLPVICSAIRGNTDLIETGVSGICCENTAASYAEAIEKMMASEQLRYRYAAAARQKIDAYDLEKIKAQMQKICGEVAGGVDSLARLASRQQLRKAFGIPLDTCVLLSVGEVSWRKNHAVIIKALGELQDLQVCFIVFGRGQLIEENRDLARKIGVGDKVIFAGFRSDIQELYCIADIFVFPSHVEGMGLAAIEAMTAGLPLISSNMHGINDYSVNGVTGFKCPPDDHHAFAENIRKLVEDRALCEKMGRQNMLATGEYELDHVKPLLNSMVIEAGGDA